MVTVIMSGLSGTYCCIKSFSMGRRVRHWSSSIGLRTFVINELWC